MASLQLFTCHDRMTSILAKKNSVTGTNILILDFLFRSLLPPRVKLNFSILF